LAFAFYIRDTELLAGSLDRRISIGRNDDSDVLSITITESVDTPSTRLLSWVWSPHA